MKILISLQGMKSKFPVRHKLRNEKERIDKMQLDHDAIFYQIGKFKKARYEAENKDSVELLAQLHFLIGWLESEAEALGYETVALASKSERMKI